MERKLIKTKTNPWDVSDERQEQLTAMRKALNKKRAKATIDLGEREGSTVVVKDDEALEVPTRKGTLSEEQIAEALKVSVGIQKDAALILNVSAAAISERIRKSKYLQGVKANIRYLYIDKAISIIKGELDAGNPMIAMFVMKKLGWLVGWMERAGIDIDLPRQGGALLLPRPYPNTDAGLKAFEAMATKQQRELLELEGNYENGESEEVEVIEAETHEPETRAENPFEIVKPGKNKLTRQERANILNEERARDLE